MNGSPEPYNQVLAMSSEMLVQIPVSSRKFGLRRTVLLVTIVGIAIVGAAVVLLSGLAHSALPPLDGTVNVVGLSAPVSVTRDKHGIPTLEAASLRDLFVAQGYVTAQDRLLQMDILRRAASGELSEVIGEATLKHDRQQRILGLRALAEKGIDLLTPSDRQQYEDYARGVNVYINTHRHTLPLEFRVLRYSPKPWTAQDSMMIAYQKIGRAHV